MSQRAIRWLTVLCGLSMLLPVAAVLVWSYVDARSDVRRDMTHVASAARDRLDSVFEYGSNQLQVLGNLTDMLAQGCDDSVQTELRDIVFRSPYFREAGVLYDDRLVCNQYERYAPAAASALAVRDAVEVDGMLVFAQRISRGSPYNLILARRYGNRATGYLIVHPAAMVDFLAFFEPNARHGVYFVYNGSVAVSSVGAIDELAAQHVLADAQSGARSSDGMISAVARSARVPVAVAAVSSTHLALRRWQQRLPWAMLAAAGLAALAFFLTRRLASAALSMRAELARAIYSGRLSLEYQPFFDVGQGTVMGVEALVRWDDRREGPLSPAVFVPLAEQVGLLPALTDFVFNRALTELAPVLRQFPGMRVSINCHVSALGNPALERYVQLWRGAGLQPGRLVFEVTERANAHFDAASAKAPMDALKAQGLRFAMDDFGVGFSNLNSLRSLPFDFLKIDKAFVDGIGPDAADSAGFVDHIIALAKRMDLHVVAEGVETEVQRAYLQRAGVNFMQGWLFARAMPVQALSKYLADHRSAPALPGALAALSA